MQVLVANFSIFFIDFFCFVVAMCNIEHNIETKHGLC